MTVTAFGPQSPNYTTTRPPTNAVASGGTDTWAKDCSAPGANDGTILSASFFNVLVANIREAVRGGGITLDDTNDNMLRDAIKALATSQMSTGLDGVLDSLFGANRGTLIYRGATVWQGLAPGAAGALLKCQGANADPVWALQQQATADYYVNGATGNDANSGTAPGNAFQTIQGAINAVAAQFIAIGVVNVHIADGTYAGFSVNPSTVGIWKFIGNLSNIGNVVIQSNLGTVNAGRGMVAYNGTTVFLSGMTFQSYLENVAATTGAFIDISSCAFTAPLYTTTAVTTIAAWGGFVHLHGTVTLTGAHGVFIGAGVKGTIRLGYQDPVNTQTLQITATGTTSMTTAFVNCVDGSSIYAYPAQVSFVGTITGKRYNVAYSSMINTQGGGANFFPGSVAGTADNATGGYYV